MGETNEDYATGHRACAMGEPLHLGIEGWSERRSRFADGWLACLSESAESKSSEPTVRAEE
jgi:hypothetical protein